MHHSRYRKHGDPRIHDTTANRYDVEWVRLDQLMRDDLLVQPRAMHVDHVQDPILPDGTRIDGDIAWLIGALVGDGSIGVKDLRLCLYGARRDRAAEILRSHWTSSTPFYSEKAGVIFSHVVLARALAAFGMKVPGLKKRVPQAVWGWSCDLQQEFLDGYCDADGHRPANPLRHGDRTYHSASRELIEDVRALHIILGQPVSNITTTMRTKPIVIKGKPVKNAQPLHAFTVWPGKGRGETAVRLRPGLATWLDNSDFTVAKVLAVTNEDAQNTFELAVEGTHNYIADGVVVRT